MHAHRAGMAPARNKIYELKEKLKEWHNQEGSEVQEDEKGCFGGAYNAWFRGGCLLEEPDNKVVYMMKLECLNMLRIFNIMAIDISMGDLMMSLPQQQELLEYELCVGQEVPVDDDEAAELWEFITELLEDGLAMYREE